ncbi:MAG: histidine ammonia-lyase, partial [Candidatus Komeilibacteria bacterium CG10_big_fil_rev_8_21_14_0_10_41_13]
MIKANQITLGEHCTVDDVAAVAWNKEIKVVISDQNRQVIEKSHQVVKDITENEKVVYGVTTGFGMFKNKFIGKDKVSQLQTNLIRSHAIGTGEPFTEAVVRAAIFIRANSLARGNSGVRLKLIESLVNLLNNGIYPYIPSQGSVGCSGDLAPLSHLTLAMMGEGEVFDNGLRRPSAEVLSRHNLQPIVLEAKEGLAMNNGTSFMTAIACLNLV